MSSETHSASEEQINRSLRGKETDELLQIWKKNDRSQWTETTFSIMREILQERLGEVPPQDLPPDKLPDAIGTRSEGNQKEFILAWVIMTLIGWAIGMFITIMFNDRGIHDILLSMTSTDFIPDRIGIFFGFLGIPLGIGLAILQCTRMHRWNIRAIPWILATAAGFAIPAIILPRMHNSLVFTDDYYILYLEYLWIIYPGLLLLLGAFIGTLQTLVLGNRMTRPDLWILANALGMLALGLVINLMLKLPVHIVEGPVDLLFNPQLRTGLEAMPLITMYMLIGALIPVLATLLIGLPTGIVLNKYGLPIRAQ